MFIVNKFNSEHSYMFRFISQRKSKCTLLIYVYNFKLSATDVLSNQ